jgi:hypothetical protein
VTQDQVPIAKGQRPAGLTRNETQSLFRLVIQKPMPESIDTVSAPEAVLTMAADLLKGYGFDWSSVLTLMSRLWAWLETDDHQVLMFNVIDRRYVGWHCMEKSVLVDMTTGDEISPARPLPTVLESIAYNLYELLRRQLAMTRGERASLWEGRDAASYTPRGEETEGGLGLGEPQVLRDDVGSSLS